MAAISRSKRIIRPASRARRGFTYKSYNFIDKDPIIFEIWDKVKGTSFAYIEEESGVSQTCLYSWFYGQTKRPQTATARAVLRSVGFDFRIVRIDEALEKKAHTSETAHVNRTPPKLPKEKVVAFRRK